MPKRVESAESPFQRAAKEGIAGHASTDEQSDTNEIQPPLKVDIATNAVRNPAGSPLTEQQLQWIDPFLEAIAEGMTIKDASARARVHPTVAHKRRKTDAEFRRKWNEAADISTRLLEQEAQRRAHKGVEEPVFYKGEQVGTVQKYSDTLLIFLLKARKPEVYRDNAGASPDTVVNISVETVENKAELNITAQAQPALPTNDIPLITDIAPEAPEIDSAGAE